jgi:hypothetical protein
MIVVVRFGTLRSLGCISSAGGISQEMPLPSAEKLALRQWGMADAWVCSKHVSIVEAYQRHVVLYLRLITDR